MIRLAIFKRGVLGLLLAVMFSVMGGPLCRFNVIRLLAFAIILSVMALAVPMAQATGPNLIVDGGFESASPSPGVIVSINLPPREGRMAFIKMPAGISIEMLQKDDGYLPIEEPWKSMPNTGSW